MLSAAGVRIGFLSWANIVVIILLVAAVEAPPGLEFTPLRAVLPEGELAAHITFCAVEQYSAQPSMWRRFRQMLRCAANGPRCATALLQRRDLIGNKQL